MSISLRYFEQIDPVPEGTIIPGWPIQGQSFEECVSNCNAFGNSCVGYYYKRSDPSSPSTQCAIYSQVMAWRTDGICGPDGRSLCRGFQKSYADQRVNNGIFRKELHPYSDQTLPGFPVYNLPTAEECAFQCESLGDQCGGFTFKMKNPTIPGDSNICWARPFGSTWRDDGLCDPSLNLCQGWSKYRNNDNSNNPGYPGVRIPVDRNSFTRAPDVFGEGGTLAGYPTYDTVKTAYDCSERCLRVGGCAAFTFKDKDPNNPNDHAICWLKVAGTTFRNDGLCDSMQSGNLCESWIKRPNA